LVRLSDDADALLVEDEEEEPCRPPVSTVVVVVAPRVVTDVDTGAATRL
jgi:hypothetical protein